MAIGRWITTDSPPSPSPQQTPKLDATALQWRMWTDKIQAEAPSRAEKLCRTVRNWRLRKWGVLEPALRRRLKAAAEHLKKQAWEISAGDFPLGRDMELFSWKAFP